MDGRVFGRTNRPVPPVWLRLGFSPSETARAELIEAALETRTVLDPSSHLALWGHALRSVDVPLMIVGGTDVAKGTSDHHAADLLQGEMLQIMSSLGRTHVDFFFWAIARPLTEFQIEGALNVLEYARQEGVMAHLGIAALDEAAAMGLWQFHDAFECAFLPTRSDSLESMARERRVGLVVLGEDAPEDAVRLRVANTASDVESLRAVEALR